MAISSPRTPDDLTQRGTVPLPEHLVGMASSADRPAVASATFANRLREQARAQRRAEWWRLLRIAGAGVGLVVLIFAAGMVLYIAGYRHGYAVATSGVQP